ncbi:MULTISPECIES: cytochrome c1 [Alteromonas]|jgi:ubiquinol-cytochrome c reductase cytochrome c1 subunit|uniref:Cytochrome C n=1 Tax=Alteromonas stellipolaris TaxID=233316 RepID=A0AAW7YW31_9ALTE|nr:MULTISPECIES: cytochrome c1 [Alteromonas]AMJ89697.1 cytochrome C [Alteromonas sp. Mac2]ALM91749.1 ubiquinol cytochrome C oxidoreductase, cytochrome C1 subunit [Alteromonas stellipolaris LMG 21856]AMJ73397.1 cytochrome C [Alteromonas stellipolaris]AMJ85839.1 cytochrome C [Alteromonas sp. Mac1]AMJ93514.1 cytochrome C [Alteromonas stellipolaris]|tara:strand:+ start:205 stop:939 length:735 start_codon:yes stop_codon:yes gene_type:complete|mmetsp:Transcript_7611/g.19640  ORF Transcript_7611/g.19640 Transcript_7611/m.19640 type:complete len:245 (-) Transcript_7611:67-801(-)
MKKLMCFLAFFLPGVALAAGGSVHLDKAPIDLTDKASLQRGAQLFMNYCLGCHSMKYQRYQRTFADLGIPDELGTENLQFTGEKVADYITRAMPEDAAAGWFGAAPPDLTLVARVRGEDWIYTYLRSFYVDESRPFGVNNKVFPEVGMPHVLQPLQGTPTEMHEEVMVDGEMVEQYVGIKSDGTGSMSPDEYDQAVADIVNFLEYTGEPAKLDSHRIGKWVLIFIAVLFVFVYLLKKEYWREVH